MYIIKITPHSFKVVLSKNDLVTFGKNKNFNDNKIPKAFLGRLLKKAKNEHGISFDTDLVEAEFFQSKDGGGELFVNSYPSKENSVTYIFSTDNFENLVYLCKRYSHLSIIYQSRLIKAEKRYCLVLYMQRNDNFLISGIGEYGDVVKVSKGKIMRICEQGKIICKNRAIQCIAHHFS